MSASMTYVSGDVPGARRAARETAWARRQLLSHRSAIHSEPAIHTASSSGTALDVAACVAVPAVGDTSGRSATSAWSTPAGASPGESQETVAAPSA